MQLPYFLFIVYIALLVDIVIVISKAHVSADGTMYARKPGRIYQDTIINTLTESSVIACVLSCQNNPSCFKAAMKKRASKQECLHLKQMNTVNGTGTAVEVELLEDASPGIFFTFQDRIFSNRLLLKSCRC